MDANRQQFWMHAEASHWALDESADPAVRYDAGCRALRLASRRSLPALDVPSDAPSVEPGLPQAIDRFSSRAYWSASAERILAVSDELPDPVAVARSAAAPVDLAMGFDDTLAIAFRGRLVLREVRGRFEPAELALPAEDAWRIAPAPEGGFFLLAREQRELWRLSGRPLPPRPHVEYAAETWRPEDEEIDPLQLTWLARLDAAAGIEADERLLEIAARPGGGLALLSEQAGASRLHVFEAVDLQTAPARAEIALQGARTLALLRDTAVPLARAFSLAWQDRDRLALLVEGLAQAVGYSLAEAPGADGLLPEGDFYPLPGHDGGPFSKGPADKPNVPIGPGRSRRLQALSLPAVVSRGAVQASRSLDSGSEQTVWHRLYLEARIPDGCALRVFLASTTAPEAPPESDTRSWHEHAFGADVRAAASLPRGSWVREASEVPFHPGLLYGAREPERAGLFTVLIQRSGRRVSALRGRHLWVRIALEGDGRTTPEVAAVRAYGSRFSYVDQYLPELYRENLFGPDADGAGPPTGADFLERFLGTFESFLTPLEDRVAGAHALTDAALVPEASIEWLASWIGAVVEPGDPAERRRVAVATAPALHRRHGTLDGLEMALEVATGGDLRGALGAVRRGDVVVVEDYRLRRTFATILGARLADATDPLQGGIAVSGNSFVGDTLFLGDEARREFLALYDADLRKHASEERAIEAFFDALAHRVTIVVHQAASREEVERIRRVAELEAPAHVSVRVAPGSGGLLVGIAALVGVDTYLVPEPAPEPAALDRARLGGHHRLERPPSLDPRLGGGGPHIGGRRPIATLRDRTAELGDDFTLDGSASRAFGGRRLTHFRWTRNP